MPTMIDRSFSYRQGFSLVELSIVLVILGLLIGGILSGQSLIRAAELRSITTDMNRYQAAFYTFRDKYFALPGDMPNATSFWGVAAGSGSDNTCYGTASTSAATCNGTGNGRIEPAGAGGNGEPHRAWQQLANAGLIEGSYTGQDTIDVPGTNVPRSRISNSSFDIGYSEYMGNWGESFSSASNGHIIFFGSTATGFSRGVAIRPEEAWNIDTKMDDGKPATGKLGPDTTFSAACYTGSYPSATYALSTTSIQCNLRFLTGL